MLGTSLGGLTANRLSSHRWYEKGETDLLTNGGLAGGLYGLAIPYLINIEDLENWNEAKNLHGVRNDRRPGWRLGDIKIESG